MSEKGFPAFIESLPEAAVAFPGVKSRLMQGVAHQAVFFELEKGIVIPPHSHCAQWGVVVSGCIEITIAGVKRVCGPGDEYNVPDGAVHEVTVLEDAVAIDFFDDPARYRVK